MEAAFWFMVAAVSTAFVGFLTVVTWLGSREKEREAHFRNEMARKLADTEDSGPLLEYVRTMERADAERVRLKARVAGLITTAVGVALMIFLYNAMAGTAAYLVGLIPLLVGVALLLLSELMMRRTD